MLENVQRFSGHPVFSKNSVKNGPLLILFRIQNFEEIVLFKLPSAASNVTKIPCEIKKIHFTFPNIHW